jgi:hypothetical protein
VIETAEDGSATITFVDGTRFSLYASTLVVLDEFPGDAEKPAATTLVGLVRGTFGIIGGEHDRLAVDTPLGQLRSRRPGFGIGTVAFGVFTFAFLPEIKADSADIALLDNAILSHKDLRHGVFEIITKGEHPQRIIVDDPTETIILRARGSSIVVTESTNSPAQMAQLQNAYSDAYTHYIQGVNDPLVQQWQHAFAQPQSGTNGSGDPASILGLNLSGGNPLQNSGASILVVSTILDNAGTGGTNSPNLITGPPPPPPLVLSTPLTLSLSENVSDENASNPIKGVTIGPTSSPVVVSLTVLNGFLHVDDSSLPPGVTSITATTAATLSCRATLRR